MYQDEKPACHSKDAVYNKEDPSGWLLLYYRQCSLRTFPPLGKF